MCLEPPYTVENVFVISCTAPDGTPLVDGGDDTCDVCCDACINVEKDCAEDAPVLNGDPIDFNIIISNCGDIPLTGIIITDPKVGIVPESPIAGPLLPGDSVDPILVTIDTAVCVASDAFDTGYETQENSVTVTADQDVTDSATAICPCDVPTGNEGCTPGFWKNNAGIDYNYKNGKDSKLQDNCWCGSYSATTTLGAAFGVIPEPFNSDTMIDGINYGGKGGPEYNMLRHAVAALLNACSGDVESSLTEGYVQTTAVNALNGVVGEPDVQEAHAIFAAANESRTSDTCIADDTIEGTCENTEKPCEDGKCETYHNCPINSHCLLKDEVVPVEPNITYIELLSLEYPNSGCGG
jgi:hypothetical protein